MFLNDPRFHDPEQGFELKLREVRESRGLSKNRLGLEAKVAPAYVQYFESGQRVPTLSTLAKLAHALGVGIGDLVEIA